MCILVEINPKYTKLLSFFLGHPQNLVWHKNLFIEKYEDAAFEWSQ